MKRCTKCKVEQPTIEFHRDRSRKDGLFPQCKTCHKADVRRWAKRNPEQVAKQRAIQSERRTMNERGRTEYRLGQWMYSMERRYGISVGQYIEMAEAQNRCCAICGLEQTGRGAHERLNVDHCHDTGKVRALLCNKCNNGIGRFNDDPVLVAKALDYLTLHSSATELTETSQF